MSRDDLLDGPQPHPLDFESFSKGTWLEASEIERGYNRKRDDRSWRLSLLAAAEDIFRERQIICRQEGDRLRLMDDLEADVWLQKQTEHSVSRLRRSARLTGSIDRSSFDLIQRRISDQRQRMIFAVATSAASTLKRERRALMLTEDTVQKAIKA
jgi:hypothetical protein